MLNQKKQNHFSDLDKSEQSLPLNGQELVGKLLNKQLVNPPIHINWQKLVDTFLNEQVVDQSVPNRSRLFPSPPVNRKQGESTGENKDDNQTSLKKPVSSNK